MAPGSALDRWGMVVRFRYDPPASPFGARLPAESVEGGVEGGEEVVRAERTDQLVALELGTDGTLELGEHERRPGGVELCVELGERVRGGGVDVGDRLGGGSERRGGG